MWPDDDLQSWMATPAFTRILIALNHHPDGRSRNLRELKNYLAQLIDKRDLSVREYERAFHRYHALESKSVPLSADPAYAAQLATARDRLSQESGNYNDIVYEVSHCIARWNKLATSIPEILLYDMQKSLAGWQEMIRRGSQPIKWSVANPRQLNPRQSEQDHPPQRTPPITGLVIWCALFLARKSPVNYSRLLSKLVVRYTAHTEMPLIHHSQRINEIEFSFTTRGIWAVNTPLSPGGALTQFGCARFGIPQTFLETAHRLIKGEDGTIVSEELGFAHELTHCKHCTKGHIFMVSDGSRLQAPYTRRLAHRDLNELETRRGFRIPERHRAKLLEAIDRSYGDNGEDSPVDYPPRPCPPGSWNPEEILTVLLGNVTESTFRNELDLLMTTSHKAHPSCRPLSLHPL